jgi:hypothetical protein
MPYVVKSTSGFGSPRLPRQILMAFVAVCFLCVVTGAINLVHHHDAHSGPADSQCQICYLLTVAAIGQIVALIALFLAAQAARKRHILAYSTAYSADRLVSASPRAPPLR